MPKINRQKLLKFIGSLASPYKVILGAYAVIVIIADLVGVITPLLLRQIVDQGILRGNVSVIIRFTMFVVAVGVTDCLLRLLRSYTSALISSRVTMSLRTQMFQHVQRLSLSFYVHSKTGALISRLNGDVMGAQSAFTVLLSEVLGNAVSAAFIVAAMLSLSWRITLTALALFPFLVLLGRYFSNKLDRLLYESYSLTSDLNVVMTERFNIGGALLVKLFGDPKRESVSFGAKAKRVSQIDVKRAIYTDATLVAYMLLSTVVTAIAYGWGGVLAAKHLLDVGTVVAIAAYLIQLYGPLNSLSNTQASFTTALVSFERVFELLDLKPQITERPGAQALANGPKKVEFQSVSFRYPTADEVSIPSLRHPMASSELNGRTVISDISFSVEPGQLVALVGHSGAGKSTISSLIPRLYDVQQGRVTINDIDVRDITLASLQQQIGVVSQEAHFFNESLRANLVYAKPDATEFEIKAALSAAQILSLVESLPDGLETIAGERGHRFSGGEKQRFAIARLLLSAPEIVLLDEATAHLDSESENAIQEALNIALRGRTSIVIAHRLSTILRADQILVIESGKIVGRGTHSQLLSINSLYADLYRRQFAVA